MVKVDETDFVLADLPGLIEGAHEGIGLGDRFLGHAERCASILHLIDGTGDQVGKTYKIIRAELEAYGEGLAEKPEIVALNKVDAIPEKDLAKKKTALEKACGHKVHVISGVSGEGIQTVLRAMVREINARRLERAQERDYGRPVARPRTRAERQSVNYSAPVVPQPKSVKPKAAAEPTAKPRLKAKIAPVVQTQAEPQTETQVQPKLKAKPKAKLKTKPKPRAKGPGGGKGQGRPGARRSHDHRGPCRAQIQAQDRQGESQAQGGAPFQQGARQQEVGAMSDVFAGARLVVVKVGSALLVDGATGTLRREWLKSLCVDVAALKTAGARVILVSSGSIALGRRLLKLPAGELRLEESQAAAAAGQVRLAEAYADMLAGLDIVAAQVLLTFGDTEERRRYLNARATLGTLVDLGAVPVINENDTVATAEIKFGDNDRLGARVASMMGADRLVLLSDVDGLYTANPGIDATATHIPEVTAITHEIEAMAGDSISVSVAAA